MSDTPNFAILGAAGGLGRAVARRLAKEGASLTLGARDTSALDELVSELGARTFEVDGSDFAHVDAFLEFAADDHHLDGVVNCAGSLLLKPAHLTTAQEFERTISANLTTAFATVRAAAKVFGSGGSIVLVSSAAATIGLQNHEAIAAAKAGVAGLARAAAATYATRGIRVNAIAPGLVATPMTEKLLATESARQASLALHPTGSAGDPRHLASLVAWLLGPDAEWVTGQVWGIDGGLATLKTRPKRSLGRAARSNAA